MTMDSAEIRGRSRIQRGRAATKLVGPSTLKRIESRRAGRNKEKRKGIREEEQPTDGSAVPRMEEGVSRGFDRLTPGKPGIPENRG